MAIGASAEFIAIWGRWSAPRAGRRLADPGRLTAELLLFAAAITALTVADTVALAIAFALILALNEVLLHAWNQRQIA